MNIRQYLLPWSQLRIWLLLTCILSASHVSAQNPSQCPQVCDWFSTLFPLCTTQDVGWGWENNQSCIGRQACDTPWNTGGVISQCDNESDLALCASMVGRQYFSSSLFNEGLVRNPPYYSHRQVDFQEGTLSASMYDVVYSGTYRCENGDVLVSILDQPEYPLDLSADLSQLSFSAEPTVPAIDYTLATGPGCGDLNNERYEVDPSHLAPIALPAGTTYFVEFTGRNTARAQLPEGTYNNAIHDCATGNLHLHRSATDTRPMSGSVEDDGETLYLALDPNTTWRFNRQQEVICPNLWEPVCSAEVQYITCFTEPCPIGVYKTFPNRCVSDNAPALFQQTGECGHLEGLPYYEEIACTEEYNPVCAARINPEACLIAPCPVQQYRTYDNSCFARQASARRIRRGECGADEGQRIFDLSDEGLICGAIYQPVCGKDESGIVCVTEPCPTHEYTTFGNHCEAIIAVADIAWHHGTCGDLEGQTTNAAPPVEIVDTAIHSAATVASAEIRDDTLFVTLRHTGCEPEYFDFQVERELTAAGEARWAFKAMPGADKTCMAIQDSSLQFDLKPLNIHYNQQYGDAPATIALPGLADYDINHDAVQAPSLEVDIPPRGEVGRSSTISVTGMFYGEDPVNFPRITVRTPTGYTVNTGKDHGRIGPAPWNYIMHEFFTPTIAGDYTVVVNWEETGLEQTGTISVSGDTGECAAQGLDVASIATYPDYPQNYWWGQFAAAGDLMRYENDVHRARWWTTAIPGADASWEFVCRI